MCGAGAAEAGAAGDAGQDGQLQMDIDEAGAAQALEPREEEDGTLAPDSSEYTDKKKRLQDKLQGRAKKIADAKDFLQELENAPQACHLPSVVLMDSVEEQARCPVKLSLITLASLHARATFSPRAVL